MENQTGVEEELEDTLKLLKLKEKTQDVIVLIKTKVTSIIKCLQTGIPVLFIQKTSNILYLLSKSSISHTELNDSLIGFISMYENGFIRYQVIDKTTMDHFTHFLTVMGGLLIEEDGQVQCLASEILLRLLSNADLPKDHERYCQVSSDVFWETIFFSQLPEVLAIAVALPRVRHIYRNLLKLLSCIMTNFENNCSVLCEVNFSLCDNIPAYHDDMNIVKLAVCLMKNRLESHVCEKQLQCFRSHYCVNNLKRIFMHIAVYGKNQRDKELRNVFICLFVSLVELVPEVMNTIGLIKVLENIANYPELGSSYREIQNICFSNTPEDFEMKQLLIGFQGKLGKISFISLRPNFDTILSLCILISPPSISNEGNLEVKWTEKQLLQHQDAAFRSIKILLISFLDAFIQFKGATRVLEYVIWWQEEGHKKTNILITRCLEILIILASQHGDKSRKELIDQNAIGILLDLLWFVKFQGSHVENESKCRIPFTVAVLCKLCKDSNLAKEHFQVKGVPYILFMLHTLKNKTGNWEVFKESYFICALQLLRDCVIGYHRNERLFIEESGPFSLLDNIQFPDHLLKIHALRICLVFGDCEDFLSQLLAWDGPRSLNILNILCLIWREEETRLHIPRSDKGCIKDLDFPLKSPTKGCLTAENDCCRLIIHALDRKLSETKLGVTYKRKFHDIDYYDKVTMVLIKNYNVMKYSEAWLTLKGSLQELDMRKNDAEYLDRITRVIRSLHHDVVSHQRKVVGLLDLQELQQERHTINKLMHGYDRTCWNLQRKLNKMARTSNYEVLKATRLRREKEIHKCLPKYTP